MIASKWGPEFGKPQDCICGCGQMAMFDDSSGYATEECQKRAEAKEKMRRTRLRLQAVIDLGITGEHAPHCLSPKGCSRPAKAGRPFCADHNRHGTVVATLDERAEKAIAARMKEIEGGSGRIEGESAAALAWFKEVERGIQELTRYLDIVSRPDCEVPDDGFEQGIRQILNGYKMKKEVA